MGYQTALANALRNRGLRVEEYSGWTTRGSSSFSPKGGVCHWTAGPCGATGRPSLNTVVNGRPDVPGPLANVYLDRDGIAVVIAAGKANHAGEGGWKGLSGNSSVFGTEAECCNAGDWTSAQREAYPKINAAFCDLGNFDESMICGHNEWAAGRKIDIHDWTMDDMRAQVAALLDPIPFPPILAKASEPVYVIIRESNPNHRIVVIQGVQGPIMLKGHDDRVELQSGTNCIVVNENMWNWIINVLGGQNAVQPVP